MCAPSPNTSDKVWQGKTKTVNIELEKLDKYQNEHQMEKKY